MKDLKDKQKALEKRIVELGRVAVAFSSGVDSTYLLKTAHDLLGDNAIAITAKAPCFMESETEEAISFCQKEGIRHIIIDYNPLAVDEFKSNVKNRCYFCKKALFTEVKRIAEENDIKYIFDGTNADDTGDYRPGMKALGELGIISPLLESGLTKAEIRTLSEALGLETFNKPSYACLASRIAYNEEITLSKLKMIEAAEEKLHFLGFWKSRVRMHGNMARIEVEKEGFFNLILHSEEISAHLKSLGFTFVSMDLEGFKSGSMNKEILK